MAVITPPSVSMHTARTYRGLAGRLKLALILLVALLQGLLYLFLMPPWQHYDEPSHFEYAWLLVEQGRLPQKDDIDNALRRELITSMIAHNFYWNLQPPDLMTDRPIQLGFSQLEDPPLYYLLVSLPLRLVHHLDLVTQLYVARLVSLGLFVLMIAVAAGITRDLTMPDNPLRWAVPLTVALLPPIADLMTAVNNDVGAVFLFSLFLWGAVRTIRFGITPLRLLWLLLCVGLSLFTKNTAAITAALLPLVLLLRIWVRFEWRWRWLILAGLAAITAVPFVLFEWHDAAYWYRMRDTTLQPEPTRMQTDALPNAPQALALVARPAEQSRLQNALLDADIRRAVGHTVTVGGWVWADRSAIVNGLGLNIATSGTRTFTEVSRPVTVTTEPVFVAWTYDVPPRTDVIQYSLFHRTGDEPALRIYLSRPFVIEGTFPADTQPVFDGTAAAAGTWAGQHFTNLLRNPSGEQIWPHLRPIFQRALSQVMPRPPAQMLPALFDWSLSWPFLLQTVAPSLLSGIFTRLAWGHVALQGVAWTFLFQAIGLVAFLGVLRWWAARRPRQPGVRPVLVLLAITTLLVWVNALIWPLPMVTWALPAVPATRYVFPSIVPMALLLAGGWWALWPRAYRRHGTLAFVALMLLVNISSIWTIWSFYQTVAARVAGS